jgi:ribonuclease HI
MYFDGSLMKTGAGAGLLFISPLGKHVRYVIRLHFPASNNVVEYEALVNGLHIAVELGFGASTLGATRSSSSTKS